MSLAGLGAAALLGLWALVWQRQSLDSTRDAVPSEVEGRQRPPRTVAGSPPPAESARWTPALEGARQVDVNAAGAAELERLPGVGPTLVQRIVEHRLAHGRFRTPDELQEVRGIGPALYGSLKDYVTTR